MYRNTKFSARFSRQDQDLLVHVAAHLQRSKSDAVRILIYEKASELGLLANNRRIFQRKRE
jgi:uncharacterized protein (DUF1778 family)